MQREGYKSADDVLKKYKVDTVKQSTPQLDKRSRFESVRKVESPAGPTIETGTFRIRSSFDDISPQMNELTINSDISSTILEMTPPPPKAIISENVDRQKMDADHALRGIFRKNCAIDLPLMKSNSIKASEIWRRGGKKASINEAMKHLETEVLLTLKCSNQFRLVCLNTLFQQRL